MAMSPDITLKESRLLLNARSFPLNISRTKIISVGVDTHNNFECTVQIQNQTLYDVGFSEEAWVAFKKEFENIRNYFESDASDLSEKKVTCGDVCLTYASSFGSKAIMLEKKPLSGLQLISDDEEVDATSQKKKPFSPVIVLQKTTFEGLVAITPCIDIYIEDNRKISEDISNLYKYIVDAICRRFTANKRLSRKVIFLEKYIKARIPEFKKDATKNLDAIFCLHHFDMIYHELFALHLYGITRAVSGKLYKESRKNKEENWKKLYAEE